MKPHTCRVPAAVIAFIEAEATRHLPNESGGILIGRFVEDGVVITRAGDAGPSADHAPGVFRRDGDHAQRLRDEVVGETGGFEDYVGEWHSHPVNVDASGKDRRSMYAISVDREYAISTPVLIVLRRHGDGRWALATYQVSEGRLHSLMMDIAKET